MALDDKRIKYFYKSNGGVSSARNYGLSKAVGDWVVFIDADDEMLPNNLEHLHSLVANYNVEIAAANVFLHNEKGLFENLNLRLDKNKIYSNIIPALIKHEATFSNGATIFNRLVLGDKPYNEKLSRYEDAEFELNVFKNKTIVVSPMPITIIHSEYAELSRVRSDKMEKDFIFNMNFAKKSFWQKVKMGQFILEGAYTYTNGSHLLKQKYGVNYYWRYVFWGITKYFGGIYRIKKVFGLS